MRFDIHIHSDVSSCSSLGIDEIIDIARARGLLGICITDHNSTDVRLSVKEGFQKNGLLLIIGMEYETDEGDFLVFMPGSEPMPQSGMTAPDLLWLVREKKGLAVAAHPFRGTRPAAPYLLSQEHCSVIEVINGRNTDPENRRAEDLAESRGLAACAGSDAHITEEIGSVYTVVTEPVSSRDEFIKAVKGGKCRPAGRI